MKQKKKKISGTNQKKRVIIISISFVILILTCTMFIYNYAENRATLINNEYTKPYEPPFTNDGQLFFINKDKNNIIKTISIEISDDNEKRTQGLM